MKRVYNMGHKEENLLARLKDWGCIATRYGRCAPIFLAAVLPGPHSSSGYES